MGKPGESDWTPKAYRAREAERQLREVDKKYGIQPRQPLKLSPETIVESDWTPAAYHRRESARQWREQLEAQRLERQRAEFRRKVQEIERALEAGAAAAQASQQSPQSALAAEIQEPLAALGDSIQSGAEQIVPPPVVGQSPLPPPLPNMAPSAASSRPHLRPTPTQRLAADRTTAAGILNILTTALVAGTIGFTSGLIAYSKTATPPQATQGASETPPSQP